jgi:hypothetical protein
MAKIREWLTGSPPDRDTEADARRIRDDQTTIRASQGGTMGPLSAGSGGPNPPPTPDVLNPDDDAR